MKGAYISRIKKIAQETASAAAKRLAIAITLRGAKRPTKFESHIKGYV